MYDMRAGSTKRMWCGGRWCDRKQRTPTKYLCALALAANFTLVTRSANNIRCCVFAVTHITAGYDVMCGATAFHTLHSNTVEKNISYVYYMGGYNRKKVGPVCEWVR